MALGDMNLFIDNWLLISTYPYEVSPNSNYVAMLAHYIDDVVHTPVS